MAVHVRELDGGEAVFVCSTTDWAFGPVMPSRDEAEGFLRWLALDPRHYTDDELSERWARYQGLPWATCIECGEAYRVDAARHPAPEEYCSTRCWDFALLEGAPSHGGMACRV